jgi:hypothetical protein
MLLRKNFYYDGCDLLGQQKWFRAALIDARIRLQKRTTSVTPHFGF